VNYASGIVGDQARAEDVVQEAYLRFSDAVAAKSVDDPLGNLYRIVRNLALDGRRHLSREKRYFSLGMEVLAEAMAEDKPTPETEAVDRGEMRLLQEALAELPEKSRIAVEMHRIGGHTVKQIAEHLGVSVGQAHSLVVTGLEHCRMRLKRGTK
jgi:RNA polymerase sigma factor (sigma-70 family)